jgi:hypothetical protein
VDRKVKQSLFHMWKQSCYSCCLYLSRVDFRFSKNLSSTPVFSGVRVAQSSVFCEMCCRSLLVCPSAFFSFGHCIVCLRFMSSDLALNDIFIIDWATRTPLNTGVERRWTGGLSSPCSTCENSRVIRVAYAWVGSTSVLVRRVWRYQRGNQNPYITDMFHLSWGFPGPFLVHYLSPGL